MSSLSNFLGQPKEIEINGIKITLHPLKVKDMAKFGKQDITDEEKTKMSAEILQLSIPDATKEEIESLPVEIFVEIMDEINKLNGFDDKDKISKLKQFQSK